ncbi:MAG: TIGR03790 family protein, partial [Thermodesulfobacteriota bacterium]
MSHSSCVFLVALVAVCLFSALLPPRSGYALQPAEVLVVANKKASQSVGLARYYMQQRHIPEKNLVQLWVPAAEQCSRETYTHKIATPIRRALTESTRNPRIRCLVLVYGMPLKVGGPELTGEEKNVWRKLQDQQERLRQQIDAATGAQQKQLKSTLKEVQGKIRRRKNAFNRSAAVDSELAMVLDEDASLDFWQPNPFFLGHTPEDCALAKDDILMVSRLDGPDGATVKRLIRDGLTVEHNGGLQGTAYFDARWPVPQTKKASSYARYDQSLHRAAQLVGNATSLGVVVDDQAQLFQPGDCPAAALYCGWYKLSQYVDAFQWQPGAIGYHIASTECATLRGNTQKWCKRMLEEGVAATIGPVEEPYVQSFPLPEVFFAFLADGHYTLAEAYLVSVPVWSWKMVLVGDPL